MPDKVVETKEREKKAAPVFLSPEKAERQSPFWCEAHGFCHGERLSDQLSDCWRETEGLTARYKPGQHRLCWVSQQQMEQPCTSEVGSLSHGMRASGDLHAQGVGEGAVRLHQPTVVS